MGSSKGPYNEEFPKGSVVKIADRAFLEDFIKTSKLHNKLYPELLNYAGEITEIEACSFYHAGDELYQLKNVPGIWHEQCLKAVPKI